jgi:D-aspartate ligase
LEQIDLYRNRRVLVLGGEENPALPVLKSLGQKGVHLSVASHLPHAPGLWSRYTNTQLRNPDPWENEDAFVAWALDICRRGRYDLVIPLGEMISLWVAKNQEEFRKYTRVPLPELGTYMVGRDKALTMKEASKLAIPIPKTFYPEEESVEAISRLVSYPAVVKPRISYGARGISYPAGPEELKEVCQRTAKQYGKLIIQEFIPQTGKQYKVQSIQDSTRKVKAVGVYEKVRYYPLTGGSSTLNVTLRRDDICGLATKFVEGIGWYGIGDCDFIEDPRDGIIKLIEINPRFTRSIRILVEAGLDFPDLLLRASQGEELAFQNAYKMGLYMRYLLPDCVWFLKSRNRFRAKPSFFRFLAKDLIYEMLTIDDPKASLAYLYSNIAKLFDSKARRKLLDRN